MSDLLTLSAQCAPGSPELTPLLQSSGRLLCAVEPRTDTENAITGFIQRRFFQSYGAVPTLRIPQLLAMTSAHGALLAAVGVRQASENRLFLEDYLQAPVETLMVSGGASDQPVHRCELVEIAHLAGVEAGVSRFLFAGLTLWLREHGYRWIVFTGTELLRNSFQRMGIAIQVLAPADPRCLPDGGAGWGRYYDHSPMVMAANVEDGYQSQKKMGLLRKTQWLNEGERQEGSYGYTA